MGTNLNKKDYEILRVLDSNFRTPFSKIAKNVGLSKNSIGLRFQKLKDLMLHNTTGINNKLLGYTLVKIFYIIDAFDKDLEEKIIQELKKLKNIIYVARHYGHYNLEIAMFVKNFEEFINQINRFNKRISKEINNKEIEIVDKEFFFGNRFLFEKPTVKPRNVVIADGKKELSPSDKKVLSILRSNPRISLLELSKKISLNLKTVISRMKRLEKDKIITGYFMMLNYSKFNLSTFKLLIQVSSLINEELFEGYISSVKNVKHLSRMLGPWDYEIDMIYPSILELQQQIEEMKKGFPHKIKRIEVLSHGKRILTKQEEFLC